MSSAISRAGRNTDVGTARVVFFSGSADAVLFFVGGAAALCAVYWGQMWFLKGAGARNAVEGRAGDAAWRRATFALVGIYLLAVLFLAHFGGGGCPPDARVRLLGF
jgi:hypothetical protein